MTFVAVMGETKIGYDVTLGILIICPLRLAMQSVHISDFLRV